MHSTEIQLANIAETNQDLTAESKIDNAGIRFLIDEVRAQELLKSGTLNAVYDTEHSVFAIGSTGHGKIGADAGIEMSKAVRVFLKPGVIDIYKHGDLIIPEEQINKLKYLLRRLNPDNSNAIAVNSFAELGSAEIKQ